MTMLMTPNTYQINVDPMFFAISVGERNPYRSAV